jgi:hypothetical protein
VDAMGCKGSKLDNQEAVALCRGRADLLAAAVRHRYALADAHGDLAESLASVGAALHLLMTAAHQTLALPAGRKVGADAPQQQPDSSHIDFTPSSDSESSSSGSSPRRDHHHPGPLPYPHYGYAGYGYAGEPPFGVYPPGSLRFYYSRSRPPPASVAVEQRAVAPERVYFGYSEPPARGYPQQYQYYGEPVRTSRSATPPPPPPPPRESMWHFFDFFGDYDVYDSYCYDTGGAGSTAVAAHTPSRSSWEVRREEGIPELEEADVVVKQVDSGFAAPGSGPRSRRSSLDGVTTGVAEVHQNENSVVDKEVIGRGNVAHQRATTQRNVAAPEPAARGPIPEVSEVAGQIKRQFVRASDAVRALAPILEVGRRRNHPRSSVYHGELFVLP